MGQPPSTSAERPLEGSFQSTLWSQVRVAGRSGTPAAAQALETLCRLYWRPIYAFLLRSGHECQNAKDLTQGFFVYVLEVGLLAKADPERGRFRSFLLGALKYFVSNQQAKDRALKRGGGVRFVPIHAQADENAVMPEPVTRLTPERLFDRKWALSVLAEAMNRLEAEYGRAGLGAQFELLQPYLTGDAAEHLPALAARLGKSDGAVRVLLFRFRNRFRSVIRAVIADTVPDVEQVECELRHLEEALRDD
jgi:DNA-directed RNA polymerase specialized sigma24 family protein